jgi:lysophospholipid acyltransferase (LPLAT)-like uncharacterized protein
MSATASTISLRISDFTGQKRTRVAAVSRHSTVGDLVRSLLAKLGLPESNVEGKPLAYQARLQREGRHVHASELVGEALEEGDEINLTPSIDAGGL